MKSIKCKELLVVVLDDNDLNVTNLFETVQNIYSDIDKHRLFIIDVTEVNTLSPEATGSFIYIHNDIRKKRKSVVMYQVKEQVQEVYHKLNLDNIVTLIDKSASNDYGNEVYFID